MAYNDSFTATAKLTGLALGSATDWYLHGNVEACERECTPENIGGRMFPRGHFAVIRFVNHDEMRDFGENEIGERIVGGPFPTERQAVEFARSKFEEVVAELS